MSVFNRQTITEGGPKDNSRVIFSQNPPLLLNKKVNSRILEVIFKNIPELGIPNYKEFDITLSKLKENGDIKLVEDDNFKLAKCLEKLVRDEQIERAQSLIDRLHVADLTAEQNYQFFAHCFAAISAANPDVAIAVTKSLVNCGLQVSTSIKTATTVQNALQLAATNFISADPKNHEMEKEILLTLLGSPSSSLDSAQTKSMVDKTNNRDLNHDDVNNYLRTAVEIGSQIKESEESSSRISTNIEPKIRLVFGKSFLSFNNKNKNTENSEAPNFSPKFKAIERLKQKIVQVAQKS